MIADDFVGSTHGKAILQSTLRLKLQCLALGKLLSHSAALYNPTTRHMTSAMVLVLTSVPTLKIRVGCRVPPITPSCLRAAILVCNRVCLQCPVLCVRATGYVVEARVSHRSWWTAAEWSTWCRSLASGSGRMWKAELPLARAAIGDSKDAKAFAMKRPATTRKPAASDDRIKRGALYVATRGRSDNQRRETPAIQAEGCVGERRSIGF